MKLVNFQSDKQFVFKSCCLCCKIVFTNGGGCKPSFSALSHLSNLVNPLSGPYLDVKSNSMSKRFTSSSSATGASIFRGQSSESSCFPECTTTSKSLPEREERRYGRVACFGCDILVRLEPFLKNPPRSEGLRPRMC